MHRVHLDHNATTPMRPEVRALLVEEIDRLQGNPSSVHRSGRDARARLDEARERVAGALAVSEDEIVFTAGGTEAINLGLLGVVHARGEAAGMVTSAIEHAAVLGVADHFERAGRPVARIGVDHHGFLDVDALIARAAELGVVSVQAANSEIGTIQPLDEIGSRFQALGKSKPIFHTDGVQALGRIPLRLKDWGADLAAFSAHKLGGPTGVGVLWRRTGVPLSPVLHGGGQEAGLRPGTENVPAIGAAALAIELAVRDQRDFAERTRRLGHSFWEQLRAVVPGVELNGPPIDDEDSDTRRLPNTIHFTAPRGAQHTGTRDARRSDSRRAPHSGPRDVPHSSQGIDGRVLVARLDLEGLEVSSGSACASGSLEPSHVLLALGHTSERARAGLRVSFGRDSSAEDVHTAVDILRRTFLALR